MSPYQVALGLADAMLAGPPTPRSVRARCARVLADDPPWLRLLLATMVRRFSNAWHGGIREAIAHAICDSQVFFESLASSSPPVLRRYVLDALRMQPRPFALEACALPNLPSVGDIADWLRLDLGDLEWLADARGWEARAADDRLRHYVYRWIPKRTGGHRLLEIPKPALRAIQRKIVHELLDYVPTHESAHGFRARHSCLTNAREHVGQEVVVRVDLEDFFTSVGGARVLALFRTLGYPDGASRVLTGLCTNLAPRTVLNPKDPSKYDFELPRPDWLARKRYEAPHLPQGAPTSPALANLCAFNFDMRLQAAAEVAGARYTAMPTISRSPGAKASRAGYSASSHWSVRSRWRKASRSTFARRA